MADEPKSLLAGGVQAELLDLASLPDCIFHEDEHPGTGEARYTAQRFFSKRPGDYKLCVSMIAARLGRLHIARLLKVHHMTVAAVEEREGVRIDIEKERIRKNLRLACGIGSERLPEIMAKLADGQVPLAMAILLDKLAQMDGEPTQRVEVTVRGHLTHEAVAANLNAFPDAIEVETTGLRADENGQKALPASDLGNSSTAPGSDVGSDKPAS
jgi:hypothetical protein